MKLYFLFLIPITFFSTSIYAQNSDPAWYSPENRKGQLFFKVASEYRITPIYDLSKQDPTFYVPVNIDKQNSGLALNLDFHFFITKNLSLGFGNSFRYGYLLETYDQIEGEFGVSPTKKTLITDHHIYLDYHIPVFKESELFVRVGKSMLNNGTNYSKKTTYYQDGNIIGHSFDEDDFFYFATNFGIGWKKKRIELVGGIYTSRTTNYFNEAATFIVPYFNFTYNLGKL